MVLCTCCSNRAYDECCGPIIAGAAGASTAEALFRARYTAFAVRNLDFVDRTHAPEIRDDFNRAEAERLADGCEWQDLQIRRADETGDTAEVEYVVRFRKDGQDITSAAVSRFRRDNGEWFFVNSEMKPMSVPRTGPKAGRNDPCPCSSGKKFKHCCGAKALA
ncbi:MAG: SEC-C domain-containing protein [Spirochaetes bacterium]|nr:SEC-C domain-containing protein [Spirochaetota bacterium]